MLDFSAEKQNKIEELIRVGDSASARALLRDIETARFSLSEKIKLAFFYRRLDQPFNALRILRPYAIGSGKKLPQSTPELRIEYADALLSLRLVTEMRRWMSAPDLETNAHARLKLAISYFYDFRFDEAEKRLDELLTPGWKKHFSDYEQLTMRMNRLTAYVRDVESSRRRIAFEKEYQKLNQELESKGHLRLLNSLRALRFRYDYLIRDYPAVLKNASTTEIQSKFFQQMANLFQWLSKLRIDGVTSKSKKEYPAFRSNLIQLREFEVLRELDLRYAELTQDFSLAQTVYAGTFYEGARQDIARRFRGSFHPDLIPLQSIELVFEARRLRKTETVSFKWLEETPLLKRVFILLASERYLPVSPFQIWGEAMDGQFYRDPSSKDTIHQLIKRLKQAFAERKIPLQIKWDQTGYRLVPEDSSMCVEFNLAELKRSPEGAYERFLVSLKSAGTVSLPKEFTAAQLSVQLSMHFQSLPKRTLQFYLKKACEEGWLKKINSRRNAFYERVFAAE